MKNSDAQPNQQFRSLGSVRQSHALSTAAMNFLSGSVEPPFQPGNPARLADHGPHQTGTPASARLLESTSAKRDKRTAGAAPALPEKHAVAGMGAAPGQADSLSLPPPGSAARRFASQAAAQAESGADGLRSKKQVRATHALATAARLAFFIRRLTSSF